MRRCQRWLRLADIPPHQPCRRCQPGEHCLARMGAAGLIGHIVNVNECIDINIAVRIQIYEWDQREKWLCDHFGIQLKFYTAYEAHVTTDCAYLKYVPHVGVCLHVLCMTRVHGGANVNVAGAVLLETCACSVRTGDVSSPGSRAVMGTSRNLTVWFG